MIKVSTQFVLTFPLLISRVLQALPSDASIESTQPFAKICRGVKDSDHCCQSVLSNPLLAKHFWLDSIIEPLPQILTIDMIHLHIEGDPLPVQSIEAKCGVDVIKYMGYRSKAPAHLKGRVGCTFACQDTRQLSLVENWLSLKLRAALKAIFGENLRPYSNVKVQRRTAPGFAMLCEDNEYAEREEVENHWEESVAKTRFKGRCHKYGDLRLDQGEQLLPPRKKSKNIRVSEDIQYILNTNKLHVHPARNGDSVCADRDSWTPSSMPEIPDGYWSIFDLPGEDDSVMVGLSWPSP